MDQAVCDFLSLESTSVKDLSLAQVPEILVPMNIQENIEIGIGHRGKVEFAKLAGQRSKELLGHNAFASRTGNCATDVSRTC